MKIKVFLMFICFSLIVLGKGNIVCFILKELKNTGLDQYFKEILN